MTPAGLNSFDLSLLKPGWGEDSLLPDKRYMTRLPERPQQICFFKVRRSGRGPMTSYPEFSSRLLLDRRRKTRKKTATPEATARTNGNTRLGSLGDRPPEKPGSVNPRRFEQNQSPVEEFTEHVNGQSSRRTNRVVATPATSATREKPPLPSLPIPCSPLTAADRSIRNPTPGYFIERRIQHLIRVPV